MVVPRTNGEDAASATTLYRGADWLTVEPGELPLRVERRRCPICRTDVPRADYYRHLGRTACSRQAGIRCLVHDDFALVTPAASRRFARLGLEVRERQQRDVTRYWVPRWARCLRNGLLDQGAVRWESAVREAAQLPAEHHGLLARFTVPLCSRGKYPIVGTPLALAASLGDILTQRAHQSGLYDLDMALRDWPQLLLEQLPLHGPYTDAEMRCLKRSLRRAPRLLRRVMLRRTPDSFNPAALLTLGRECRKALQYLRES